MFWEPIKPSATAASRPILALEFIRRYFCQTGTSPSYAEIGAALGFIDRRRVTDIVRELRDQGLIMWTPGKRRAIRLPQAIDQLADSEMILALRERGWIVDALSRAFPVKLGGG